MTNIEAGDADRDAQIRMYYKFGMSVWRLAKGTGLSEARIRQIVSIRA